MSLSPILFGWSHLNTWYYGVRYARTCHPGDLWVTYFTSSKTVKAFREKHGEPDVIEVRQTFNDSLQAREWEHKVLRRIKAVKNKFWLNKCYGKCPSMLGRHHSEESKNRMSDMRKRRKSPFLWATPFRRI